MSEIVYSKIGEGETGKLISVSVPYNPSKFRAQEDIALARTIHGDLQQQIRQWLEEEFERETYGR